MKQLDVKYVEAPYTGLLDKVQSVALKSIKLLYGTLKAFARNKQIGALVHPESSVRGSLEEFAEKRDYMGSYSSLLLDPIDDLTRHSKGRSGDEWKDYHISALQAEIDRSHSAVVQICKYAEEAYTSVKLAEKEAVPQLTYVIEETATVFLQVRSTLNQQRYLLRLVINIRALELADYQNKQVQTNVNVAAEAELLDQWVNSKQEVRSDDNKTQK